MGYGLPRQAPTPMATRPQDLTLAQMQEIVAALQQGETYRAVAAKWGLSVGGVQRIKAKVEQANGH